jgi:hypothetical protein
MNQDNYEPQAICECGCSAQWHNWANKTLMFCDNAYKIPEFTAEPCGCDGFQQTHASMSSAQG